MKFYAVKEMWRKRWLEAWKMRQSGKTYQAIADYYGIKYPTAYNIVQRGKRESTQ